jgi:hypothetical protein
MYLHPMGSAPQTTPSRASLESKHSLQTSCHWDKSLHNWISCYKMLNESLHISVLWMCTFRRVMSHLFNRTTFLLSHVFQFTWFHVCLDRSLTRILKRRAVSLRVAVVSRKQLKTKTTAHSRSNYPLLVAYGLITYENSGRCMKIILRCV